MKNVKSKINIVKGDYYKQKRLNNATLYFLVICPDNLIFLLINLQSRDPSVFIVFIILKITLIFYYSVFWLKIKHCFVILVIMLSCITYGGLRGRVC